MVALHISDVKGFMALLLTDSAFDSFYLVEGDVSTSINYHIDGHINQSFYSDEELEELKIEEFQDWKATRPMIVNIVKGKKLPVSMKFVLKALPKNRSENATEEGKIESYLLNIRFENNSLMLITGVARSTFTLDRSGETEWDDNVKGFLLKHDISYEEC